MEGLDLQVLESNDWDRFRPEMVVAECLTGSLRQIAVDPVARYLMGLGYEPYAKTGNSIIFSERSTKS